MTTTHAKGIMTTNKFNSSGICIPSKNDVLSGRGMGIQNHDGNKRYRATIEKWKKEYVIQTRTKGKDAIAKQVILELRSLKPSARFLIKLSDSDIWYPQDEIAILAKVKQALREKPPQNREQLKVKDEIKASNRRENKNAKAVGKISKGKNALDEGIPTLRREGPISASAGGKNRSGGKKSKTYTEDDMNQVLQILRDLSPDRKNGSKRTKRR